MRLDGPARPGGTVDRGWGEAGLGWWLAMRQTGVTGARGGSWRGGIDSLPVNFRVKHRFVSVYNNKSLMIVTLAAWVKSPLLGSEESLQNRYKSFGVRLTHQVQRTT